MHRFFVAPELLIDPGLGPDDGLVSDPDRASDPGLAPLAGARPGGAGSNFVPLPKEIAHQVRDVLHLNVGEHLILLDNSGDEVVAAVARSSKAGVEVHLLERRLFDVAELGIFLQTILHVVGTKVVTGFVLRLLIARNRKYAGSPGYI